MGGSPRRPSRSRPLVSRGAPQLHQPSGAAGNVLWSSAFSSSSPQHLSGGVCGQYNGSGLPEVSGGNQICDTKPDGAGSAAVGGDPFCHSSTTIYYGAQQRVSGCAILPESDSGRRVDPETLGLPSALEAVASDNRPFCNISESPLLTIFFSLPRSQLNLWSDALDVGWGAHLGDQVAPGRWSPEELRSSINHRELQAMFYGLQHFLPLVHNTSVAVYADNTTALAYLRHQGGTRSAILNQTAQDLLRWAEIHSVTLLPQFIMGRNNVLVDALSRPNQILGAEWTLKLSVFHQLWKPWPVTIDLFATSLNHHCLPYFSPFHDPNYIWTDALLQPWDGWQTYAFPPYALIPAVLKKLRSSFGVLLTIIAPYWPQRP